jgi:hypothetical protein
MSELSWQITGFAETDPEHARWKAEVDGGVYWLQPNWDQHNGQHYRPGLFDGYRIVFDPVGRASDIQLRWRIKRLDYAKAICERHFERWRSLRQQASATGPDDCP